MIFGSVCSGIEAASVAWKPLGWKAAWFSEIEPFPCAVLKHHYPKILNLGDMTKLYESPIFRGTSIEILVGGTPCQSFSIAGLRKGMDDPRGNLALVFLGLIDRARPRWVVWENVPGVLSSSGGRDFGSFIGGLAKLGYGLSWRVLDAQHFGVPQRRKRVFVVGYLGDWRPAAAVLFESASLSGNPPQSRQEGQSVAGTIRGGAKANGGSGITEDVALCLDHHGPGHNDVTQENYIYDSIPIQEVGKRTGKSTDDPRAGIGIGKDGDPMFTLQRGAQHAVCYDMRGNGEGDNVPTLTGDHASRPTDYTPVVQVQWTSGGGKLENPTAQALRSGAEHSYQFLRTGVALRCLTPQECERLQGFPDDYTRIAWGRKPAEECPDGPRYKAIGNSMAVPVMRWIGQRIALVEKIKGEQRCRA